MTAHPESRKTKGRPGRPSCAVSDIERDLIENLAEEMTVPGAVEYVRGAAGDRIARKVSNSARALGKRCAAEVIAVMHEAFGVNDPLYNREIQRLVKEYERPAVRLALDPDIRVARDYVERERKRHAAAREWNLLRSQEQIEKEDASVKRALKKYLARRYAGVLASRYRPP